MRKIRYTILLLTIVIKTIAQPTFKVGWNTYKSGMITHQYTYKYMYTDSTVLLLIDTLNVLNTADSMVVVSIHTPMRERSVYKTASFMDGRKQLVKTEEYKDESLLSYKEWKYDDKNRKYQLVEENKLNGTVYKKNYDYSVDKKNGDVVVAECAHYNGKVEFYTKSFYNKKNEKYKEVRLNDNNKDVVHVESYTYGDNGKLKERTVFFPEFKVTKRFEEKEGTMPPKCYRTLPLGTLEKPNLNNRIPYIKRVLFKNQSIIYDKDCELFEYKFTNNSNCEIIVSTTKTPNIWQVVYRFKERI